jgi:hypothetical protein
VGQIVGRILRIYEIPYTALELDPDQVQMVRRFGAETYWTAMPLDWIYSKLLEQKMRSSLCWL